MSDTREAVARAIDPYAWPTQPGEPLRECGEDSRERARRKADAAISAYRAALEAEGFVIMKRINTQSVPLREALERYGHLCVDEGTRPTDPGTAAMREGEL